MTRYKIEGGKELNGELEISGAKNAAVAIIPAALMAEGICRIENVPQISDVTMLFNILRELGAEISEIDEHTVEINATDLSSWNADFDAMRKIRASYYLIGALLGRFGKARVCMPGGCNFGGTRPIDQHIKGFEALGAKVDIEGEIITVTAADGLIGTDIYLDVVSVGATINIMLAACFAKGRTVIENVAREPHIVDVANFLNSMGADIRGAGTNVIKINGIERLFGCSYSIIPDQIEAGTYMAAVAGAGGSVLIKNVIPKHLDCISGKLRDMGVVVEDMDDAVRVTSNRQLKATYVRTLPYPGFPTDMQPQIATVLCLAKGKSKVNEGIWSNRFKYVEELKKMGADITVRNNEAVIDGKPELKGAFITAMDLRAGAAMLIAGLCAEGETIIDGIGYIERGYETPIRKLRSIGADIEIIEN